VPARARGDLPWEGFTDAYRDLLLPGGIREDGFIRMWTRQLGSQRLDTDLRREQFERPLRDEWWRSLVPALDRIEAPMLVCGSFSDHCLHSARSFRAFERTGSAQRWLYTHRAGKWATFYSADALATQQRFLDHFLEGEDNGQADQPAMRLAVHDGRDEPAEVRWERKWPLAGTEWRRLHLLSGGRLDPQPSDAGGEIAFDLRSGAGVFGVTVPEQLELTGPMAAHLRLELRGTGDANLFVGVEKWRAGRRVPFEGSYGYGLDRVTTGWLKASHRALDAEASRDWAPVHTPTSSHSRCRRARSSTSTSLCDRPPPGSSPATSCAWWSAGAGCRRATRSWASSLPPTRRAHPGPRCCTAAPGPARTCSCRWSNAPRAPRRTPTDR
jgi:uncharacterized protein